MPTSTNSEYLNISRTSILFFLDMFFGFTSLYLAFLLKYDWSIPPYELSFYFRLLPLLFIFRSITFLCFRLYSRFWEYASLEDIGQIINSVITGSLLILFYISGDIGPQREVQIPYTILIIDTVILIGLQVGSRVAWKGWRQYLRARRYSNKRSIRKVFIWGAGSNGALLLESLQKQYSNYFVVGLIDDDDLKLNNMLKGVKVLGNRHNIPHLIKEYEVEEILIAAGNMTTENLNDVFQICHKNSVKFKVVPSYVDMVTKEIQISKIRDIEISDLLGREPIQLDVGSIRNVIQDRVVMVTGAGGSIGTELCEKLLEFEPAALIMVDRGENYLHELNVTLDGYDTRVQTHFIYGSVTNKEKMEDIFRRHRPTVVFHAAANKHVPLMEVNVDEAIVNNVYGTKVVADLSDAYKVEQFVLVSTDKVVKPTSIMGMTKRIAEQYIRFLSENSNTRFLAVRFGNVLGSKGSIVPMFKQQISRGGPVTVTHPDMERFFMLIPEAVGLILQAVVMSSQGGNVFVLDMGNPVKIVDLARKMIQISGYKRRSDIEIRYVGIRPGEKLKEELSLDEEEIIPTFHDKIKMLRSNEPYNPNYDEWLDSLCRQALDSDAEKIKSVISEMIPDMPNTTSKVRS
jgi:FlaA1/EpsC-like NDP-sugar epimerase